MDKELARHVVVTAIRASTQLGELIPLLRKHCTAREARVYVRAIARAVGTLGLGIHTASSPPIPSSSVTSHAR